MSYPSQNASVEDASERVSYFPYNPPTGYTVPSLDDFEMTLQTLCQNNFLKIISLPKHSNMSQEVFDKRIIYKSLSLTYNVLNKVECTKAFLPYFQSRLTDEKGYCQEMQERWINTYRFAIKNNVENRRNIRLFEDNKPYVLNNDMTITQKSINFLVPFLPFIQDNCEFVRLPDTIMNRDPSVQQLSNITIKNIRMLKDKTELHMSAVLSPVQRIARSTDIVNRIIAEAKEHTAQSDQSASKIVIYFNHLIDLLSKGRFIEIQTANLPEISPTPLLAFQILDASICINVFRDMFSSNDEEFAVSILLQNEFPWDHYLSRMSYLWHYELGVMIYNAPPHVMGQNEIIRRFCSDHTNGKPFNYIVPLLPFIQNGVIFLQIPPTTMESVQDLSFNRLNVHEDYKAEFIEHFMKTSPLHPQVLHHGSPQPISSNPAQMPMFLNAEMRPQTSSRTAQW